MCIYLAYPFFAGFRCDEHNHSDVIAFGNDTIMFLVITEREIGDNDAVDTTFHTFTAEILKSELHDWV